LAFDLGFCATGVILLFLFVVCALVLGLGSADERVDEEIEIEDALRFLVGGLGVLAVVLAARKRQVRFGGIFDFVLVYSLLGLKINDEREICGSGLE